MNINLSLAGQPVEGRFALPAHRSPKRVVLPVLHSLAGIATAVRVQGSSNVTPNDSPGAAVSCRKGCDACCRQMVPLALTEAHALQDAFEALAPPAAQRVLARFERALGSLEKARVLHRLRRRAKLTAGELEQLDRDYFAARIACPFLERRACMIHARRPLACREFLVTSDPRHCAAPGSGRVERVELPAKPSVALCESDGGWVPLVLAREYTARHKESLVDPADAVREILQRL